MMGMGKNPQGFEPGENLRLSGAIKSSNFQRRTRRDLNPGPSGPKPLALSRLSYGSSVINRTDRES